MTVHVSLDNIKAQVETLLRTLGTIKDSEEVVLTFGSEAQGQGLVDKTWQDMTIVPVHIEFKEGVIVHKVNV